MVKLVPYMMLVQWDSRGGLTSCAVCSSFFFCMHQLKKKTIVMSFYMDNAVKMLLKANSLLEEKTENPPQF